MLDRVTITGADYVTSVNALVDLSAEFPFVEWGILVSESNTQHGTPRFPPYKWIERYMNAVAGKNIRTSMHVCGKWVRQLLKGELLFTALPELQIIARRIQINTHAEPHILTRAALDYIAADPTRQYIVQLDDVNDLLLDAAVGRGMTNVAGLSDCSHGAGVLPVEWPLARYSLSHNIYHGYAGGLGPDNVERQLTRIGVKACGRPFWIDMEGRVRNDRQCLDLDKVRQVLEICAPFVEGNNAG